MHTRLIISIFISYSVALSLNQTLATGDTQLQALADVNLPALKQVRAPLLPDGGCPPDPYGWAWIGNTLKKLSRNDAINDLTKERIDNDLTGFLVEYAASTAGLFVIPLIVLCIATFALFIYPCILCCAHGNVCCCFKKNKKESTTSQKVVPLVFIIIFAILSLIALVACADSYRYVSDTGLDDLMYQLKTVMPATETEMDIVLDGTATELDNTFTDVNRVFTDTLEESKNNFTPLVQAKALIAQASTLYEGLSDILATIPDSYATSKTDIQSILDDTNTVITDSKDYIDSVDPVALLDVSAVTTELDNAKTTIVSQLDNVHNSIFSFTGNANSKIVDFTQKVDDNRDYINLTVSGTVFVSLLVIPCILIGLSFYFKKNRLWVTGSMIAAFILFCVVFVGFFVYVVAIPSNQVCEALHSDKRIALIDSIEDVEQKKMFDMFYSCRADIDTDVFLELTRIFDFGFQMESCQDVLNMVGYDDNKQTILNQVNTDFSFPQDFIDMFATTDSGIPQRVDTAVADFEGELTNSLTAFISNCCEGGTIQDSSTIGLCGTAYICHSAEPISDFLVDFSKITFDCHNNVAQTCSETHAVLHNLVTDVRPKLLSLQVDTTDLNTATIEYVNSFSTTIIAYFDELFTSVESQLCGVYDSFLSGMSEVIGCHVVFNVIDPPLLQICNAYIPSIGTVGVTSITIGIFMYIALLISCCCFPRFKKPIEEDKTDKTSYGIEFESVSVIKTHVSESISTASADTEKKSKKKHKQKQETEQQNANMLPPSMNCYNMGYYEMEENRQEEGVVAYAPIYPILNMNVEGNVRVGETNSASELLNSTKDMTVTGQYYDELASAKIEMNSSAVLHSSTPTSSNTSSSSSQLTPAAEINLSTESSQKSEQSDEKGEKEKETEEELSSLSSSFSSVASLSSTESSDTTVD